jgi:hypothetical protein
MVQEAEGKKFSLPFVFSKEFRPLRILASISGRACTARAKTVKYYVHAASATVLTRNGAITCRVSMGLRKRRTELDAFSR